MMHMATLRASQPVTVLHTWAFEPPRDTTSISPYNPILACLPLIDGVRRLSYAFHTVSPLQYIFPNLRTFGRAYFVLLGSIAHDYLKNALYRHLAPHHGS